MNVSCDDQASGPAKIPLECLVNFQHNERIKDVVRDIVDLRKDLLHMKVGSDYDLMDNKFRNFAGSVILDTNESFGLRTQWVPGEMGAQYQIAWLDPKEVVAGSTVASLGPWTTIHFQPKSEELLIQYMEPGIWTAAMLSDTRVIAATEFLVLPESSRAYEQLEMKERLRWAKKFFGVNRLCEPSAFSNKFTKTCLCAPPPIPTCESTAWSTLAPDAKSNFASFLKRQKGRT